MKFLETGLSGVYLVGLEPHGDDRGFFARQFCLREFDAVGLSFSLAQANTSFSSQAGTLRGMHYQLPPAAETKLVRCIRGSVWDCVVDLRPNSPTFKRWFGADLTEENRRMMVVPKGFAHGFITRSDNSEVLYLVDEFYSPESERGVRWDDPAFGIKWPLNPTVISDRDRSHPDFKKDPHPA